MFKQFSMYFVLFIGHLPLYAQFPDKAGSFGSSALEKESLRIVNWAISCKVNRGPIDISQMQAVTASFGSAFNACQAADNKVISLGDGGSAILTFEYPIIDGAGADFAVYENAFDDHFLELAFVEVSSDGINFYRFPSFSYTQDSIQIGPFGYIPHITGLHNLAGKYKAGYGTPFDLAELDSISGLNTQLITHIRIADVIGSINPNYASKDSRGIPINDPWPTPFETCGFDLDAVAVLHEQKSNSQQISVNPNPVDAGSEFSISASQGFASIIASDGKLIAKGSIADVQSIHLSTGLYLLRVEYNNHSEYAKFIVH